MKIGFRVAASMLLILAAASEEVEPRPQDDRVALWIGRLGHDMTDDVRSPLSNLVVLGSRAVPSLLKLAASPLPDPHLSRERWHQALRNRLWAVLALGQIGDPSAAAGLQELARNPATPPALRAAAALALGSIGGKGTGAVLLSVLPCKAEDSRGAPASPADSPDYVRRAAALGLARLGPSLGAKEAAEARGELWRQAEDDGNTVHLRIACVLALAELPDSAQAGRLLGLLGKTEEGLLKEAALLALGTCAQGKADLGPCLGLAASRTAPAHLRNAAAISVAMGGRAADADALRPLLDDAEPEVLVASAVAVGGLLNGEDPGARLALIRVLKDRNLAPEVRAYAGISLGFFPGEASYEAIRNALLKSREGGLRINASNAAGHLKDPDATPALLEALEEKDPFVLWSIIGMLGERGAATKAVERLAALAQGDPEPYVRQKAAAVLELAPGETADRALAAALGDPEARVRRDAALSAGASGRRALEPRLKRLLEDELDTVRWAAGESLACLASGKPSPAMARALTVRRTYIEGSVKGEWERLRQNLTALVLQTGAEDLLKLQEAAGAEPKEAEGRKVAEGNPKGLGRQPPGAPSTPKVGAPPAVPDAKAINELGGIVSVQDLEKRIEDIAALCPVERKWMSDKEVAEARKQGRSVDYYT